MTKNSSMTSILQLAATQARKTFTRIYVFAKKKFLCRFVVQSVGKKNHPFYVVFVCRPSKKILHHNSLHKLSKSTSCVFCSHTFLHCAKRFTMRICRPERNNKPLAILIWDHDNSTRTCRREIN